MIVYGGSIENMTWKENVNELKLPMQWHPCSCNVARLCNGNIIPITSQCLFKFSIERDFEDGMYCALLLE